MHTTSSTQAPGKVRARLTTLAWCVGAAAAALTVEIAVARAAPDLTPDCSTVASPLASGQSALEPVSPASTGLPAGEKARPRVDSAAMTQNPITCAWTSAPTLG